MDLNIRPRTVKPYLRPLSAGDRPYWMCHDEHRGAFVAPTAQEAYRMWKEVARG